MNLNELVRGVLDDFDDTDPQSLADLAIGRIPDYEVGSALRILMRGYVQSEMSRTRQPALPPSVSKRVAAVRETGTDEWDQWLRDRVSVGPNMYKQRRDMTYADCLYAAQLRRDIATKNLVASDEWEQVAAMLQTSGVDTVGDLPRQSLLAVAS